MAETYTTAERMYEYLRDACFGNGDMEVIANAIAAEIDELQAELEARRLVMAEQERLAAMPRSVSWGGVGELPRLRG